MSTDLADTDPIRTGPSPTRVPVVIVGAGPVGVMAALLLARRGIRSVVLERHRGVYPLPRALAMDDEVRRILQAAGVHEEFAANARTADGMRMLDARHRVMAEFRRDAPNGRHGYPQTTLFDQPDFERQLRKALSQYDECELRGGVEVIDVDQDQPDNAPAPVRVTLRPADGDADGDGDGGGSGETEHSTKHRAEHLWADVVLGCDGANSMVREAIGAAWEDLRFEERWLVLDVRTSLPVRSWGGVDQVCDPARPATFMRSGEDRYRWEFRLADGEDADSLAAPSSIRTLIQPWIDAGEASADDFEIIRQAEYTFRARIADRWRRGRIFLLGDAAHLTPPFIGQGLCTGLRDAYNLAWKLARVLGDGADEALLDSYQSEREPHARHMIRLAVATGWTMTGGQDRAAAVRRTVLGIAWRIPGMSAALTDHLSPALARGPLVDRRRRPRQLVGSLCPQPWIAVGGQRVRLDDVLGEDFAVVTVGAPTPSLLAAARVLDAPVVDVADSPLAAWLRRGRTQAAVVRPDRVVLDVAGRDGSLPRITSWAPLLSTPVPPSSRRSAA